MLIPLFLKILISHFEICFFDMGMDSFTPCLDPWILRESNTGIGFLDLFENLPIDFPE